MSKKTLLAGVLSAALMGTALADHQYLIAQNDPTQASFFQLTFDGFGFETAGAITQTDMIINLVPAAGVARIVGYDQQVQPLDLPGVPPVSTGDITVSVAPGSSAGTFDAGTNTFSTNEFYVITFTEDLSAYGLTSPVALPGASTGVIDFVNGKINLEWEGVGQLADPLNPGLFLTFSYNCVVNTVFTAVEGCDGDVNLDGQVGQDDLNLALASFGLSGGADGFNPFADFDGSGTVDQADLNDLLSGFGSTCR